MLTTIGYPNNTSEFRQAGNLGIPPSLYARSPAAFLVCKSELNQALSSPS
jgi:hypothetical protein